MTITFHDYTAHDFDECCGIFVSNTPEFFREAELPAYQKYLRENAPGNYWVLRDENSLMLACGGLWLRSGYEARLCYGMVRSEYRKKGLGSLMLAYRLQKLMDMPAMRIIQLDTSQHNPEFFKRFGFETVKTEINHYAPGLHRHDMELVISNEKRALVQQAYDKLNQDPAD